MSEKVNQTKDLTPSSTTTSEKADVKFTKKQKEVIKETIAETVDKELNVKSTEPKKEKKSKASGLEPPKVVIKKQVSSKKSRNLVILFSCLGGAALIGGAGALIYTLTHKAKEVVRYNVIFLNGDGAQIHLPISLEKGAEFKEAVKQIDYKDVTKSTTNEFFTGEWYTDEDCSKRMLPTDKIESNLTVYPKFDTDKGTRNVSFSAGDGKFIDEISHEAVDVKYPTTFGSLKTPYAYVPETSNSYTAKQICKGWTDEYGKVLTADTPITTNLKLEPIYGDALSTCFIHFIIDSKYPIQQGCICVGVDEGTTLENIICPISEHSIYGEKIFNGWTTTEGSKEILPYKTSITDDLTLYPVFEDVSSFHTVTFNANGGSFPTGESKISIKALETETFGNVLSRIQSPTKDNQELWYWEDANTHERILSTTTMTADLSVNAIYYPTSTDKYYIYYEDGKTCGWIDSDTLTTGNIKIHFSTSSTETTVEINREEFNSDIYVGDLITEIPNDFLYGCKAFNSDIKLTENITKIGNNFLKDCESFNKSIVIPSSVTTIGTYFMNGCKSFDQEFTFPSTLTDIGLSPLLDCDTFNSLYIECPLSCFKDNDNEAFATNNQALTAKPIIVQSSKEEIRTGIRNKWPDRDEKPYRYLLSDYFGDSFGIMYNEDDQKVYYFDDFDSSNICTDNESALITLKTVTPGVLETKTWPRNEFNKKIYFNYNRINEIPAHFLENCTAYNQEITGLENVTKVGNFFMSNCQSFNQSIDFTTKLSTIGESFLEYCHNFNQPIKWLSNVLSIPNNFMLNDKTFNSSIILADNLTTIGKSFMQGCTNYSSELIVPHSVTSVGEKFMYNVDSISSIKLNNAASSYQKDIYTLSTDNVGSIAYTQGILIKGDQGADQFVDEHPNRTTTPYRKLKENGKTTVNFSIGSGKGTISYTEKKHVTTGSPVSAILPTATPSAGYNAGIWYDKKTGAKLDLSTAKVYDGCEYEVRFQPIQYTVKWRLSYCSKQSGPDNYVYNQDLTYKFTTSKSGASWHYEIRVDGNILDSSRYTCDQSGNLYIPGQWVTGTLTIKVSYL